jgi:hypothetical protein
MLPSYKEAAIRGASENIKYQPTNKPRPPRNPRSNPYQSATPIAPPSDALRLWAKHEGGQWARGTERLNGISFGKKCVFGDGAEIEAA